MVVTRATKSILSSLSPSPSKSIGLQLLLRGGFIHPVGKGLFSLLPNGQRSVDRLVRIIEKELNGIGAQKVSFPILGPKELWDKTGRWETMGTELMTVEDRMKNQLCLQPTAEEMCTQVLAQLQHLKFKKDLFPVMLYQTTEKFRDEMNPRFGLLRGRQFLMNDLYSFDRTDREAVETYGIVSDAYERILSRQLQLDVYKVRADSGVHGGKLSHEYHLKNPLNEDAIDYCMTCKTGGKPGECTPCVEHGSERLSTVEIAHTFQLGSKYAETMGLMNQDSSPPTPMEMCCFGIGVTRLLHAAAESLSPSMKALRLPSAIVPYDVAVVIDADLIDRPIVSELVNELKKVYEHVLLDDRVDVKIMKRMNELNRIAVPRIVLVGKATLKTIDAQEPLFELLTTERQKEHFVSHGDRTRTELMQMIQDTVV